MVERYARSVRFESNPEINSKCNYYGGYREI